MSAPAPTPTSIPDPAEVLSVKQVAALLGVHAETVYDLIAKRELRAKKVAGRYYIRRCWVDDLLDRDDQAQSV